MALAFFLAGCGGVSITHGLSPICRRCRLRITAAFSRRLLSLQGVSHVAVVNKVPPI